MKTVHLMPPSRAANPISQKTQNSKQHHKPQTNQVKFENNIRPPQLRLWQRAIRPRNTSLEDLELENLNLKF